MIQENEISSMLIDPGIIIYSLLNSRRISRVPFSKLRQTSFLFPGNRGGVIRVGFARSGANRFTLPVSDEGVRLPPDFDPACARSMGIQLVRVLSEQLCGERRYFSEGGSSFRVECDEYGEAERISSWPRQSPVGLFPT